MRRASALTVVVALVVAACVLGASAKGGLVFPKVERTVDLTSCMADITTEIVIRNDGSTPVKEFDFFVPANIVPNLALVKSWDANENELAVKKVGSKTAGDEYRVTMLAAVGAGERVDVTVQEVYTRIMSPFPTHIAQNERQLVVYTGTTALVAPYLTEASSTVYKLPSALIESHSDEEAVEPVAVAGTAVTYGPYEDVAAYASVPVRLHFENNRPFVVFTELTQSYEVSHWGNIAVEDAVVAVHTGAALDGSFSRYEYQRNPQGAGASSVRSLRWKLPVGTADVYYRDVIGNISTSNLWIEEDASATFDTRPRFPLFGGWRTSFLVGYNLPISTYLATEYESGDYVLTAPFGETVLGVPTDHVTVRVVLPEGASNIRVESPVPLTAGPTFETHHTFLDTQGRPVVVFSTKNIVPDHEDSFVVRYTFSSATKFREPIMLIAVFFTFFLAAIVYVRLEFSITPSANSAVQDLLDTVVSLHERRLEEYERLDAAHLRKGSDGAKKAAESALRQLDTDLSLVAGSLAKVSESVADRVKALAEDEKARAAAANTYYTLLGSAKPAAAALQSARADLERIASKIQRTVDDFRQ